MRKIRLGVNIDHIATLRNARGGVHPCPILGAAIAKKAGADGITAHLREDRRHIRDEDIFRLKKEINLPLNFEMAATDEMVAIALKAKPNAVCLVPEKRQELTTEGGLDVIKNQTHLTKITKQLKAKKIRISLFIDADLKQILAAKKVGADIIELHTGKYCHLTGQAQKSEFKKISEAAEYAEELELECHAGHGLDFKTAKKIAEIPQIVELNIGHFLIGEAVFNGLGSSVKKMKKIINSVRK
ncbi:MAG: pyridoxine 5-phosphate synthase [Rickettsiaceae bacterium]|jgi:pyridoxine 5-phosphate synthase|nr:pyridoxine 5-phosphate synthase [Rickettsiaceae bacterium]